MRATSKIRASRLVYFIRDLAKLIELKVGESGAGRTPIVG